MYHLMYMQEFDPFLTNACRTSVVRLRGAGVVTMVPCAWLLAGSSLALWRTLRCFECICVHRYSLIRLHSLLPYNKETATNCSLTVHNSTSYNMHAYMQLFEYAVSSCDVSLCLLNYSILVINMS